MVKQQYAGWESSQYLESILANLRSTNEIADSRANFLVGVSGVILSLAIAQLSLNGHQQSAFLIIALSAFLSMFITIGVIRPKIGVSKTNTMYHLGILKFSRQNYEKELLRNAASPEAAVKEYAEEVYDFSLELNGRYRMIRFAADVLAAGLAIGLALLVVL